ncbi:MAG: DUF438 domain-containing protein, partial [Chloroflexi bacterium]|nr:DUF438 domain-containing protein [Chloroflexota bacterium]
PLHTFNDENQVALRMLEQMCQTLQEAVDEESPVRLHTFMLQLERLVEIDRHYLRKENLLFPYLERYGFQGPSKVMWGLHDSIRSRLRRVRTQGQLGMPGLAQLQVSFAEVAQAIRGMVYKEEKILFPAALSQLKESDWAAIRGQEDELGYFLVAPGSEWAPVTATGLHAAAGLAGVLTRGEETALSLHTGALSLEQIDLLLRSLPVDVTFVDEDDRVCYFSQTRARIFERTPAIIGRKVQNCHPPRSVDRVQRILDDFRAGGRETAEFWVHLGPRFVHIRYFALHDADGRYRGALEVTQDIAPLRALEGEKRLLDEAGP